MLGKVHFVLSVLFFSLENPRKSFQDSSSVGSATRIWTKMVVQKLVLSLYNWEFYHSSMKSENRYIHSLSALCSASLSISFAGFIIFSVENYEIRRATFPQSSYWRSDITDKVYRQKWAVIIRKQKKELRFELDVKTEDRDSQTHSRRLDECSDPRSIIVQTPGEGYRVVMRPHHGDLVLPGPPVESREHADDVLPLGLQFQLVPRPSRLQLFTKHSPSESPCGPYQNPLQAPRFPKSLMIALGI